MAPIDTKSSPSLAELPIDELVQYGQSLGLQLPADTPHGEALRLVRQRQELLVELDHDALLDVVAWLREPVRRSASKEQLAEIISRHSRVRFGGLSLHGLHALARLHGVKPREDESRDQLERRLRKARGWSAQFKRFQRRLVGSFVARIVDASSDNRDYKFLPEDRASVSIRSEIEETGLVGGVARKLRGVADDYLREKLDEIESRIDRKLDEIDKRLAEWRDREVAHRFKLLKLTLVFTILVAALSLLYDYFRAE